MSKYDVYKALVAATKALNKARNKESEAWGKVAKEDKIFHAIARHAVSRSAETIAWRKAREESTAALLNWRVVREALDKSGEDNAEE